jgi:glycerol-3-phosphate dehydrogenase
VEDVLARRTRALPLDARASVAAAPRVAKLMAAELDRDETWQRQSVLEFSALARGWILD